MIPLPNSPRQIKFNYVNMPFNTVAFSGNQTQVRESQTNSISPIKIEQNIRTSEQKNYKFEAFSSLELQTRKDLASQKRLSQGSTKGLEIVPIPESTSVLEAHQSLHKAEQLDPIKQSIAPKVEVPILKAQNFKGDAPKFKIQGLQQIRESDFFKGSQNDTAQNQNPEQISQSYNANPHSNWGSRGAQSKQNESEHHHLHGKRLLKQIKTFKIEKIEEKKESEFTGCCGFGIAQKVSFLSKEH